MNLSKQKFVALAADFNVIPVSQTLLAGSETPLGTYAKLCKGLAGTFLLESAEHGVWARYSFIGVESRGSLTERSGKTIWTGSASPLPDRQPLSDKPLEALTQMQAAWNSAPVADFPLSSGLVGYVSWRAVSLLERLPEPGPLEYPIPLLGFSQFSKLVVHDHAKGEVILVVPAFVMAGEDPALAYEAAVVQLADLRNDMDRQTKPMLDEIRWDEPQARSRTKKSDFLEQVDQAQEFVRRGDVFQVVISQRFSTPTTAEPIDVYRAARAMNPSPYMYLLNLEDSGTPWSIVGSSPEALVTVNDGHAVMHPIAGSRPRGQDANSDSKLAAELLADTKEQSEHLMLVDLARNDLLKFCKPDSVSVTEFMQVHRFSHVMHLVSTVEGLIRSGMTAVDALLATFPAGTLSGAPKPRALEIIHDLEPVDRGLFGGVVGYFDFSGNTDLAIAIRTAVLREGVAHVQAGAGIVLDSVPESEHRETEVKSDIMLRAVAAANSLEPK